MSAAVVRAPRATGVESFGGAITRKLRLPPGDVADLVYVFTTIEADAGLRSHDVRFGERSQPTLTCERCGRVFTPESKKAIQWRVVFGRGEHREKRDTWEDEIAESDKVVYSVARFCDRVCRRENERVVEVLHQEWRSPPLDEIGERTKRVVVGDGREVTTFERVEVRRLPPGPDDVNERETMALMGASPGGGSQLDLLELEDFVYRRTPRQRRAWACAATLQRLARAGDARSVFVLSRLYGTLDPNARYQLWGRGAGLAQYDSRETASIAPLTSAVRSHRIAPGDGDHAPIDRALREIACDPRGEKESKRNFQVREREVRDLRRAWLAEVGAEAERLIAHASVAYRTMRRSM